MKVGIVSTYPPLRCAIGLYSRNLARSLVAHDPGLSVIVIAEEGAEPQTEERIRVFPSYRRDRDYAEAIVERAVDSDCRVVHFQHAPDLFGCDERLPRVLEQLRAAGIRTVVTLHTVYGSHRLDRVLGRTSAASFHRALASHCDRIVVHHDRGMATTLRSQGVDSRLLSVIPHGTVEMTLPPRAAARAALDLPPQATLFTFFGFIHRYKNVHCVVEAFLRIGKRRPEARLLVAGMPWGDRWYNHLYVAAIKARVRADSSASRVFIRDWFIGHEDVPKLYASSDVILLPHRQDYGSASGVFHQAVGAGRPVLCATGPKFVDAQEVLASVPELCVPPTSVREWARAMERVLDDPTLLQRGGEALRHYAARTAWPVVGKEHAALYATICGM